MPTYIPGEYEMIEDNSLEIMTEIIWWNEEAGLILEYQQYPIGKVSIQKMGYDSAQSSSSL